MGIITDTITTRKHPNQNPRKEQAIANELSTSINVVRATVASALTFDILYAGCWLGVGIHFPVTHMFVSFFITRPIETLAALFDGLCWSILFGAVFGFVLSLIYNILPFGRA